MPVLTVIDSRKIQEFLYASNRLADIVAGSAALEDLFKVSFRLSVDSHGGKFVAAAGGNLWATFPGSQQAHGFVGSAARTALEKTPGLELAAVHVEFAEGGLAAALMKAGAELARFKLGAPMAAPLLGISVTARCPETGMPAVELAPDKGERWKPRSAVLAARYQYKAKLHPSDSRFEYPLEFDHLGRDRGDTSQIAVVYLDGNGIGRKIRDWLAKANGSDETFAQSYGRLTDALSQRVQVAWAAVDEACCAAVVSDQGRSLVVSQALDGAPRQGIEIHGNYLPIRPVLLGGDDLTFVCDGRVGLDLAAKALRAFEAAPAGDLGRVTACAGVAIVGSHFPVIQALATAHQECAEAKRKSCRTAPENGAISWRVGHHRPEPTARPYMLGGCPGQISWHWFENDLFGDGMTGFNGERWRASRNKFKALATMAADRVGLEREMRAWRVANPQLGFPQPLGDDGCSPQGEQPLVDAVELSDLYWKLPSLEGR